MEEIIVVVICLFINALLSAFEMAFVSVPKVELKRLAREGSHVAAKLLPLRDFPERTLSVIQIGITLVGAISAAVGGAGASESIEPYFIGQYGFSERSAEMLSIALVVVPLTYLSVVVGELVPKTLALRTPLSITLMGARTLFIADKILGPIISLLEHSTRIIVRILFAKSHSNHNAPDESSVELTHFTKRHRQFIINMAAIESRLVRDISVPWEQVTHIDMNDPIEKVVEVIFHSGHTRLPVTQGGVLAGVVNAKEVLAVRESGISDWLSVLRPAVRISGTDTALNALKWLQEKRSHIAIVDDLKGIVTIEDVSEEIFGEFYDEEDDDRVQKLISSRAKSRLGKND